MTAEARLPADVTSVPLHARLARRHRHRWRPRPRRRARATVPCECCATTATTRLPPSPRSVRCRACAASRGPISTAKACPTRPCSTIRASSGSFSTSAVRRSANEPCLAQFPRVAALAIAELSGDGIVDVLGIGSDGTVTRLSTQLNGSSFEAARVARFDAAVRAGAGQRAAPGGGSRQQRRRRPHRLRAGRFTNRSGLARRQLPPGERPAARRDHRRGGSGRRRAPRARGAARRRRRRGPGEGSEELPVAGDSAARGRPPPATSGSIRSASAARSKCEPGCTCRSRSSPRRSCTSAWAKPRAQRSPASPGRTASCSRSSTSRRTPRSARASGSKGSCPWLFAWNGKEMGFVTDFIWRSPLGLRINAQATADVQMTEDWVRIRGDQLAPRNGQYDLRSPRSCGRRTSSISSRCSSSIIRKARRCSWTSGSRCRRRGSA